ncbi:unnamed protein product [Lactuca saligna]|uniref:Uncharacterized protein n=1 Tax=Lactuca saligna TaxID=75948 RepID=A0AA36EF09_LACSI|nr:unnamed protein product [Lactuca saligna]
MKIQQSIDKNKGIHAQEMELAIQQLLIKVKKLNLVSLVGPSRPSYSTRIGAPKQSKITMFLLPYGTRYINNKLPTGVEPVQYMFIREPEHGIFYLYSQHHMCFQHTDDLPATHTEHLFHLRFEGLGHFEIERGYHGLISLELSKRLQELQIDEFRWTNFKILKEFDKLYDGSSDESK